MNSCHRIIISPMSLLYNRFDFASENSIEKYILLPVPAQRCNIYNWNTFNWNWCSKHLRLFYLFIIYPMVYVYKLWFAALWWTLYSGLLFVSVVQCNVLFIEIKYMCFILYENIDQILPKILHGPMHYTIGVTCVYNGHMFYTLL